MSHFFAADPVETELSDVLHRLASADGAPVPGLESHHVDLKRQSGPRTPGAGGTAGDQGDVAARALVGPAVCMANTAGGGALIVGVEDDGTPSGTTLDAQLLRRTIYDLTERRLTVEVREVRLGSHRLLVVRSPEAIQPIPWRRRYHHRMGDRCVEIDGSTLADVQRRRGGWDWSQQDSHLPVDRVRAASLTRARDFLHADGDPRALDLAEAGDQDLLRRLDVVTPTGTLTNAGAIVFVGREAPAIDYLRRHEPGGDRVIRLHQENRGLLEELWDVDAAIAANNPLTHRQKGLVISRVPQLPPRAAREAVVNGVAHREWNTSDPVTVEHIGGHLVVTSPGGFVGDVSPTNIITHPSQPRNRALTRLLARLRVAEAEGIGVDRMVVDMLSLGYPQPTIEELPGPVVRTALLGSHIDEAWMAFRESLVPTDTARGLDVLLAVRRLVQTWWVDQDVLALLIQKTVDEASDVMLTLSGLRCAGGSLTEPVGGVPTGSPPALALSTHARRVLAAYDRETPGPGRPQPSRADVAVGWALHRGRISSTELASILGIQHTNVQKILKDLEDRGTLAPGRATRRGPGFFYVPVTPS